MTVSILGRYKWEWGPGDVVVLRVDDRFFSQCVDSDDHNEADEIEPKFAADLLTRRKVTLTVAGKVWMDEQRKLRTKFQMAERKTE